MIILGIDPGFQRTGFGVIKIDNNQLRYIDSGCIQTQTTAITSERLQYIFKGIQTIVTQYQPHEAAIEEVFMHQNPNSAIKLGQARGAAIVASQIPFAEYAAREIKQTIVGYGAASKDQIQYMVKQLLNITIPLQVDAADALAIALCHAVHRKKLA